MKKHIIAHKDGYIRGIVRGNGEIYAPKDVEVKNFETEKELDDFIIENNLKEHEEPEYEVDELGAN